MNDPWICESCGEPNQGGNCAKCGRTAPAASPQTNSADSYLGIMHGAMGFRAAPRSVAIGILVVLVLLFIVPTLIFALR